MTSRRSSDAGGSVLSFTFLDVLMCTMGSLLLLLVVFGVIVKNSTRARRPGEQALISLAALSSPTALPQAVAAAGASDEVGADELSRRLADLRSEQEKLRALRTEVMERRDAERERISGLEDHERRLEHDLGQLYVTLQALEAAEKRTAVDQQQAEAQAKRLQDIIRETEAQLAELRKNGGRKKSYAIVPYKGRNGTFRRPVFIECTADAVTIQPEGVRLTVQDFDGPLRSGNPLAAAIRAAHEELNGRATAAGQADMPDPYPLLIVRPNGAAAYSAALDAIRTWESDYGYEFVESEWKLSYPAPDPKLAQVMAHAVDEARQRQAMLARVAPRRYGPRLAGAGAGAGGSGRGGLGGIGSAADGDGGGGFSTLASGNGDRIGQRAGNAQFGGGSPNPLRGGDGGENFSDEFAGDATPAGGVGDGGLRAAVRDGDGAPDGIGGRSGARGGASTSLGVVGDRYASAGAEGSGRTGRGAPTGTRENDKVGAAGAGSSEARAGSPGGNSTADGGSAADGSATAANGGGAAGGGASSSAGGGSRSSAGGGNIGGLSTMTEKSPRKSAADTRGANWANAEASRRASAITRPIRVVVGAEQLAVLGDDGVPASDAAVVSFEQPVDQVMDQLAASIQQQMGDWGLAGDGMYWRPMLLVAVEPGAERQAARLAQLLDNSGVDVRLPNSPSVAAQETDRATR